MKQEFYDYVQKGFRILLQSLSGYIGRELNKAYRGNWWLVVRETLSDQMDLPIEGSYSDLIDSLDAANCIRLLDRKWNDLFADSLKKDCRTWAKELMGVRNIVAHLGNADLEQRVAERALDTMCLLCKEIDPEGATELEDIYMTVRGMANKQGIEKEKDLVLKQPLSESSRGELKEGSLLNLVGTDMVRKTALTRKITYSGKTVIYPVYQVRLDALFYNDQNDRIATWITRYEAENGDDSLSGLNVEIYNRIIENFIVESNPDAINKTQNNIALVGQREPGVTLADGRIVDGNRRYTCLRRIQRGQKETLYFETVIMDMDIYEDRKQIKLLELSIQHGEEKKVDYDLIDYAIGTYRDVVQTGLLTIEEYASSANESIAEVKKRIEIAKIVCEFLNYIRLPEQYHVAREYQIYSLFQEMLPLLKQLKDEEKEELKTIAFNNTMMHAIQDQRKYIRDIKGLIKNGTYLPYFDEQKEIGQRIMDRFVHAEIRGKEDVEVFAAVQSELTDELKQSMEKAMLHTRSRVIKNIPSENVSKSIALMMEVDTRVFVRMSEEEKEVLKGELAELERIAGAMRKLL